MYSTTPVKDLIKGTVAWDFWTLFFCKLVVPGPLIYTLNYFHHLLRFHRVIGFLKKMACIKHGSFWISMFQYTDIFESPCIETQIFKNFCVLYTRIFESLCIEKWRLENMNSFALQNLLVSIHGDFWISVYWNTKIQKSPCINHRDFWISMYWNTEIQKSPCFRTRRLNFV